jgi:ferredoxin
VIRIHVNPQVCVGAGQCVRTVPEVFDQRDSDGIVVLLASSASDELLTYLQKAVKLCPSQAISIEFDPKP